MEGVAMSMRKEVEEDLELPHLIARIEAKFCLYSLAGLTTVEVVRDYEDKLWELKELTEEVMVRMQEKMEKSGLGKLVNEWREKMMMAKEKLVNYMTEMRLKEKVLRIEKVAMGTIEKVEQTKEEVNEKLSVVKRRSAEESTKQEENTKSTRLEDKATPSPYPKRVKSMPQKCCEEVEVQGKSSDTKSKIEKKEKHDKNEKAVKAKKKSRRKNSEALSNHVPVRAESEARAGRCCLCAFTSGQDDYQRRRVVLIHQARTHFKHQVQSTLTSSCPSCPYTPPPLLSSSKCYSPSAQHQLLLQHWSTVHPTLLTWVQARYNLLEEEKKSQEEADTGSDEEDDIRITEINVKDN